MKIELELKQYEAEKLREMIGIQTNTKPDIVVKSLIKMLLKEPSTKMILFIMATLAEWELKNTKERKAGGIERARKNGRHKNNGGNKPKETIEQFSINLMCRCA